MIILQPRPRGRGAPADSRMSQQPIPVHAQKGRNAKRGPVPGIDSPLSACYLRQRPPYSFRSGCSQVHRIPRELECLLSAPNAAAAECAWEEFVREHSRLLLHVARSYGGPHDAVMDRYAWVLEHLRADGFRRLEGYMADGRGRFTTWLVVVARRLCVDQIRTRYGRAGGAAEPDRALRRRLEDMTGADLDLDVLPMPDGRSPEDELRAAELRAALRAALEQLPAADRLVLRLRYQDEVPVSEITRILSLPSVFHVYRRVNGILDRLRASLRLAGVEDAAP
jgi:RNA polymerase sigma factor (sigma-70 family)